MKRHRLKRHTVVQPDDKSIRLIPLTQGQNAIVDAEDFERVSQFNWFAHWAPNSESFYAKRTLPKTSPTKNGRQEQMGHMVIGVPHGLFVDHKNHDTLDYRKTNLRAATCLQNNHNGRARNPQSGYKGVHKEKTCNRWRAQISFRREKIYLGLFSTPAQAYEAYKAKALELHGEFASL